MENFYGGNDQFLDLPLIMERQITTRQASLAETSDSDIAWADILTQRYKFTGEFDSAKK